MHNFSDEGVTIASILDDRRKKAGRKFPVKIRVTYKRVRHYYNTGKSLSEAEWEKLPSTRKSDLKEAAKAITRVFEEIKKEVIAVLDVGAFSFESLNRKLGRTSTNVNLAFKDKINRNEYLGKFNTADWYRFSLKSIENFAGGSIPFNVITPDWLKRYESELLVQGKSYTTISMYMRALQVIVNEAKNEGIIKLNNHPFGTKSGKYSIPQPSGRKMALKLEQIGQIANFECTGNREKFRDIWLFLYFCNGANVSDVAQLKFSNIHNDEISFYRQKTIHRAKKKVKVISVLTPEMKEIIKKWGNKPSREGFLFPFLNGDEDPEEERRKIKRLTRNINDNVQKIGEKLGLTVKISSNTARHSFATVLKRSGAKYTFISESLGHTDMATTQHYLDSFEEDERIKNASFLTNF